MSEIKLRNINKKYGETQVLSGFSETFADGGSVAVMGPSGSGKTTLLRLIMGLEKPDGGEIIGTDKERFACVFQENRLIEHCSAPENLRLVLKKDVPEEAIIEELKSVGIGVSNPEELTKPVSKFSGGMKRRVAIVRAVCHPAELLLLDEPFKGLDEKLHLEVIDYIRRHSEGRTVICVTHEPEDARRLGGKMIELEKIGQ